MGRGANATSASSFSSVLGTGRHGSRISEEVLVQRQQEAQQQAFWRGPVSVWLASANAYGWIDMSGAEAQRWQDQIEQLRALQNNPGGAVYTDPVVTKAAARPADIELAGERIQIKLLDVGPKLIQVIKAVRSHTKWSLRESKQWCEYSRNDWAAAAIVVPADAAFSLISMLEIAGATVSSGPAQR
jgi:ribosomal protein L7/L12